MHAQSRPFLVFERLLSGSRVSCRDAGNTLLCSLVNPTGPSTTRWQFSADNHLSRSFPRGRITVQVGGRRPRWSSADAPTPAARRTCLLSIDCGEQLLHGARRRCAERLVELNRLCKLLADEVIASREFAVATSARSTRSASQRLSVPAAYHGSRTSISWRSGSLSIVFMATSFDYSASSSAAASRTVFLGKGSASQLSL
jgi:hypothetical protein